MRVTDVGSIQSIVAARKKKEEKNAVDVARIRGSRYNHCTIERKSDE